MTIHSIQFLSSKETVKTKENGNQLNLKNILVVSVFVRYRKDRQVAGSQVGV